MVFLPEIALFVSWEQYNLFWIQRHMSRKTLNPLGNGCCCKYCYHYYKYIGVIVPLQIVPLLLLSLLLLLLLLLLVSILDVRLLYLLNALVAPPPPIALIQNELVLNLRLKYHYKLSTLWLLLDILLLPLLLYYLIAPSPHDKYSISGFI